MPLHAINFDQQSLASVHVANIWGSFACVKRPSDLLVIDSAGESKIDALLLAGSVIAALCAAGLLAEDNFNFYMRNSSCDPDSTGEIMLLHVHSASFGVQQHEGVPASLRNYKLVIWTFVGWREGYAICAMHILSLSIHRFAQCMHRGVQHSIFAVCCAPRMRLTP